MSHSSLEANEGGQMRWKARVILRERLHLTTMSFGPLAGQEPQGTMSWCFELTVGLQQKTKSVIVQVGFE